MYHFEEKSAIAKVLSEQRREFLREMHSLRKASNGGSGVKVKEKIVNGNKVVNKFFVLGDRLHGWTKEIFDVATRDKKGEYFFFWMNGIFCRYFNETSMFDINPAQEVYTADNSDGSVDEIRLFVSGDEVVEIKDEDKELYRKLNLQRKATLGALESIEAGREEDFSL